MRRRVAGTRTLRAEAADRREDHALVPASQLLEADPTAGELALGFAGDHDIVLADQPRELAAAVLAVEVERDPALAGVEVEEGGAALGVVAAVRERSERPCPVTLG